MFSSNAMRKVGVDATEDIVQSETMPAEPLTLLNILNKNPKSIGALTEENFNKAYFIFHEIQECDCDFYHIVEDAEKKLPSIMDTLALGDQIYIYKVGFLIDAHQEKLREFVFSDLENNNISAELSKNLLLLQLHEKLSDMFSVFINEHSYHHNEAGLESESVSPWTQCHGGFVPPKKSQSLCECLRESCMGFFTFSADTSCFAVIAQMVA